MKLFLGSVCIGIIFYIVFETFGFWLAFLAWLIGTAILIYLLR